METSQPQVSRRSLLRGAGVVGVACFVGSFGATPVSAVAVPTGADRARLLTEQEMTTLEALVDRIVPGPPEDTDPGAVAAGCADAIDALLAAFQVDPPRIYAGAPFSDRGGVGRNDFQQFLPLDPYETVAWRLRIEGSAGRPELERNGAVSGYQQVYREGLAALERAVPVAGFSSSPGPARDLVLEQSDDPAVRALVDVAVLHTLEVMYGAPEYGGNRDLVGWELTGFEGDTQPRGWTREEVEQPERGGLPGLDGAPYVGPGIALGVPEMVHGLLADSGGEFSRMRRLVRQVVDPEPAVAHRLAEMEEAAATIVRSVGGAAGGA